MDRNPYLTNYHFTGIFVALRKESVDRNHTYTYLSILFLVALRKESVDRNFLLPLALILPRIGSLSARRAWIEIPGA